MIAILSLYASLPEYKNIREFIKNHTCFVSVISSVEVLGYHRLDKKDKIHFEAFFALAPMIDLSSDIYKKAIDLRQQKKMSLGDSLISATALAYNLTLVTHNLSDFQWIKDLKILDPIKSTV